MEDMAIDYSIAYCTSPYSLLAINLTQTKGLMGVFVDIPISMVKSPVISGGRSIRSPVSNFVFLSSLNSFSPNHALKSIP